MTSLLQASGLSCGYDGTPVVRDLDLHVDPGEVVVLLGANGAGKTTTLLTLAGVVAPLGGTLDVLGRSGRGISAPMLARAGMALIPDDRGLFPGLSVEENLRLAGLKGRASDSAAVELFPELAAKLRTRAGLLSGGEQQMLAIARSTLRAPRLLLLDELSLGLAPLVVRRLLPVVVDLARNAGCGVLLVEQHVQLALEIADRAYVLNHGRVAYAGGAASDLRDDEALLRSSYLGEEAVVAS